MLGFSQLLERDAPDATQRARAGQVLRAGRHLLDLIDDLIDVSRIEAGQLSVSLEPVLATDALRDALELIMASAAERGVAVEIDVHRGLYRYVLADARRLRQVMLNLLSNAVKYNRPTGTVRVSFDEGAAGMLRLLVSNTGPGIEADQIAQVFVAFERLGQTTGRERGTGLGLSVSKGLVAAMGGEIGVDSTPGELTTFWVDLRLTEARDHGSETAACAASAWAREDEPPSGRILYIEDNPANAELVREVLAQCPGLTLTVAANGAEGLRLAGAERPALILLDAHLPDISGEEILARLRAGEPTASIPVVAISADASSTSRRRLRHGGARDYLTKPIDVAELVRAIAQQLGASAGADVRDDG